MTDSDAADLPPQKITEEQMDQAWAYANRYYDGRIEAYELMARYRPEVVHGYMTLRQAAFNTGPDAALSPKFKELIILAIEIAREKSNPPPIGHAIKAVNAGATPAEIAEVASLCILIGGMLTYHEAGKHALQAAEEHYAKLHEAG